MDLKRLLTVLSGSGPVSEFKSQGGSRLIDDLWETIAPEFPPSEGSLWTYRRPKTLSAKDDPEARVLVCGVTKNGQFTTVTVVTPFGKVTTGDFLSSDEWDAMFVPVALPRDPT